MKIVEMAQVGQELQNVVLQPVFGPLDGGKCLHWGEKGKEESLLLNTHYTHAEMHI